MSRTPLRILVTGATGFVGTALVKSLATNPHFEVVAAVRESARGDTRAPVIMSAQTADPSPPSGTPVKRVVVGDIHGSTNWQAALNGVDVVIHLAARVHVMRDSAADSLAECRRINVDGTCNLARQAAAGGVKRFVFLSSVKVHGDHGSFSESDIPVPVDSYGISKLEAEVQLRAISADTRLELVIVRPPLVYGFGVKANFHALVRLVQRGVPLPFGAVRNRRSLVSLENLVSLLTICVEHSRANGETFLVSDGHDLSTPELLRQIGSALGKPVRLIPVPHRLLQTALILSGKQGIADRLLGTLTVDIGKARELLQWTPPLDVAEALRRMVIAG